MTFDELISDYNITEEEGVELWIYLCARRMYRGLYRAFEFSRRPAIAETEDGG